jgi:hypothetical protein
MHEHLRLIFNHQEASDDQVGCVSVTCVMFRFLSDICALKDDMQEHLRLKFNHQEASDDQVGCVSVTYVILLSVTYVGCC